MLIDMTLVSMHLQRNSLVESVRLRFTVHSDPECQWVCAELLLCSAGGRGRSTRKGDGDGGSTLVASGGVNSDTFDSTAISGGLPCQARSAEIASLAVNELGGEVVMFEGFEGPGGTVYC
jgi:hypothetical protein